MSCRRVFRWLSLEDPENENIGNRFKTNKEPDNNCEEPNTETNDDASAVVQYGFRLLCKTAMHPLEYAKTLIQIGYEPIAPRPGRTLFGVRRLILPNIFQYAHHIGTVDGFTGCFRGLSAKLLGNILSSYYSESLVTGLGLLGPTNACNNSQDEFLTTMQREVVIHLASVAISQPFHVVSVRMMAQFVGRETLYSSLWQSVKEIWSTEGLAGFYSGVVPRLIVDLGCIAITSTAAYLFCKFTKTTNKTVRSNVNAVAHFTVSSWLYPYHVVSTCMIVNGSRLRAGNPPLMDNYFGWRDCYKRLHLANEHKRGASFFFRTVARVPAKLNSSSSSFASFPELK